MSTDDLTLMDMLTVMSDKEFKEFALDHRAKIELAITNGHYALYGPAWDEELEEYRQAVREAELDRRQQEKDFQDSKGVHRGSHR